MIFAFALSECESVAIIGYRAFVIIHKIYIDVMLFLSKKMSKELTLYYFVL